MDSSTATGNRKSGSISISSTGASTSRHSEPSLIISFWLRENVGMERNIPIFRFRFRSPHGRARTLSGWRNGAAQMPRARPPIRAWPSEATQRKVFGLHVWKTTAATWASPVPSARRMMSIGLRAHSMQWPTIR